MTLSDEILTLETKLKHKELELSIAYQTSLELIETNNELQQQFEAQCITIHTLDANIVDCEMKIDLLQAQNMEYQQTILQTNDKYEQLLGELAVTKEHLNNSKGEINEYQHTIQLLNHDIIHNTNDKKQILNYSNHKNKNNDNNNEMKDKLSKQQHKYDELLRECERYHSEYQQLLETQIEIGTMKNSELKHEKRAKLLSAQIVDLTHRNVQLENEINDYNSDINQQNQTIQYLQSENQKLIYINNTKSTFINNNISENNDLKRRLSVRLRDNFGYNSKLVMFANNIEENEAIKINHNVNDECHYNEGVEEGHDLFTMVQMYGYNEVYNDDMDRETLAIEKVECHQSHHRNYNLELAMEEELWLVIYYFVFIYVVHVLLYVFV